MLYQEELLDRQFLFGVQGDLEGAKEAPPDGVHSPFLQQEIDLHAEAPFQLEPPYHAVQGLPYQGTQSALPYLPYQYEESQPLPYQAPPFIEQKIHTPPFAQLEVPFTTPEKLNVPQLLAPAPVGIPASIKNPFIKAPAVQPNTFSVLKLVNTLPVLIAFSSMILSKGMIYVPEGNESILVSLSVLAFVASFLLGSAKVIHRFNSGSQPSEDNYQNTFMIWGSVAGGYFATSWLGASRSTVILFGLYLNQMNLYTLISFFMDIYITYNSKASIIKVILGYTMILLSVKIISKRLQKLRGVSLPVLGVVGLVSIFPLILNADVSLSIVGVNLASSVILIVSLHYDHADLKTNLVPSLLAFLAAIFQFVILLKPFDYLTVINIFLPLLIQPNYTTEEASDEVTHDSKSILKELLSHSDTRAIFNFLLLNSTFMFIQLLYSFRSKSLGLLSDSLHMALDCTSLALGLVAGILSKNEINANGKYPFGLKNFEILAGFTNGTLLVGISGSIVFEAVGRLWSPVVLQKTNELIIVSILGLLVNLVGIFAFNHGHNHGHGHTHGHSHLSEPKHEPEHHHEGHSEHQHAHVELSENLQHQHGHVDHSEHEEEKSNHTHSHAVVDDPEHEGMNDNMKGIFLHILADTLGSVGVVISTLLTKFFHWDGFDPVALIIIAVLIFFSAIPLIKSTASTLLLQLNSNSEKRVRSALTDVTQVKGVKSFTTPRFWPSSNNAVNGYIHVQVYRGESLLFIKSQCEELFVKQKIDVMIQMENDYDNCWCRDVEMELR